MRWYRDLLCLVDVERASLSCIQDDAIVSENSLQRHPVFSQRSNHSSPKKQCAVDTMYFYASARRQRDCWTPSCADLPTAETIIKIEGNII